MYKKNNWNRLTDKTEEEFDGFYDQPVLCYFTRISTPHKEESHIYIGTLASAKENVTHWQLLPDAPIKHESKQVEKLISTEELVARILQLEQHTKDIYDIIEKQILEQQRTKKNESV